MKKVLLTGAVLTVLGLLLAFTIPALAHGLGSDEATSTNNEAWEDMYEACQNGDWAAMTEAAGQFQSEDYDNMPYYENYNSTPDENGETSGEGWSGTGNHMGDGLGSSEATSTNNEAWEDMYEACQNGDWAAMTEAAGQFQSEDYDNMPYYENYNSMPDENGETSSEGWSGTGNHMGGGMMGGGMMGW